MPSFFAPVVRNLVAQPAGTDLGKIRFLIETRPELSRLQQNLFVEEWLRLTPQIRRVDPFWQPPSNGYFSVMQIPFTELFEAWSILSVPASVFGSARDDLSIISCLHDISGMHNAAVDTVIKSPGPSSPARP